MCPDSALPPIEVRHVALCPDPANRLIATMEVRIGEVTIRGARLLRAPDCPQGATLAAPRIARKVASVRFSPRLREALTLAALQAVEAKRGALPAGEGTSDTASPRGPAATGNEGGGGLRQSAALDHLRQAEALTATLANAARSAMPADQRAEAGAVMAEAAVVNAGRVLVDAGLVDGLTLCAIMQGVAAREAVLLADPAEVASGLRRLAQWAVAQGQEPAGHA